ncbi:MAG: hypothetical protein P4L56_00805 [Candidatus Sulfopaludibacter sp.]|nr:hypothetical protein [Candidatus Sulfopaludibacter sp.]
MAHSRFLFPLACATLAFGQGADSILLLNQTPILAVNRDTQDNLLVAARTDTLVTVSRYDQQGQLLQSFTGQGRTLNAGGNVTVLASDSAGILYLGAAAALIRPADDPASIRNGTQSCSASAPIGTRAY